MSQSPAQSFFPPEYVLVIAVVVEIAVSISRSHGSNYRRMVVAEVKTIMMMMVRMVIYIYQVLSIGRMLYT